MPYDPKTGQWKPENESVSQRVTGLMSQQSPLMQQARTQGAQVSNRRGLLNSSMGTQAGQTAAYGAALPIASQEASQAHQRNTAERGIQSQENIAQMNVAAHEREKAASLAAAFENSYAQMVATVMNNHQIPANVRQQYLQHAGAVRDSNLRLVEQLYGFKLNWSTPS